MPVLAKGYSHLLERLKQDKIIADIVAKEGIDALLSGNNNAISDLRKGNKELVTVAEKEAEQRMTEAVKERFPEHAVIGEECGFHPGNHIRWIFDPVDGTSAMIKTAVAEAYGIELAPPAPSFGITIAVADGDEAILGIVTQLEAAGGTLRAVNTWMGEKGRPTRLNGSAVSLPNAHETLANSGLACTVPQVMFNSREKWSGWQALMEATRACVTGQNCIGFMKLLQKNSGIHIAYESDLAYHDAAALVPILEGAGIKVSDHEGRELHFPETATRQEFTLLAASPSLHAEALLYIKRGVPEARNRFAERNNMNHGYAEKFPAKGDKT